MAEIRVLPSILSADFADLKAECQSLSHCTDWFHVDIMDGHFVPNLTLGPCVVKSLRKHLPSAHFDCHLMVTNPRQWAERLIDDSQINQVSFHLESVNDIQEARGLCKLIRNRGVRCAVAIKPETEVCSVIPLIQSNDLDGILLMSVQPGFGGQEFLGSSVTDRITELRSVSSTLDICVDGGINELTAPLVGSAGANMVVAGSAVFGRENRVEAYRGLVALLTRARQAAIVTPS